MKGVLGGEYKNEEIFTGLVEVMVKVKDKEKHDIGLQGFKYAPGVKEFAHILSIHYSQYTSIQGNQTCPCPSYSTESSVSHNFSKYRYVTNENRII